MSSDSWYEDTSWQNAGTREFLASVELWCPAKTTNVVRNLKQPQLPRRVSDKRDSIGGVNLSGEERKLREKPSWFRSHVSSTTANGSWRSARCKLTEETDRSTLNIYVDETILQHSIFIHLLRCTDIRPADRSLFFRNDCLGIHVKAGQKLLDNTTEEDVYLKFPCSDAINTWIALLRSYAIAEIYGRNLAPSDGGLYRMWRQIYLDVKQARNLGIAKPLGESPAHYIPVGDGPETSNDLTDMEVSCEIIINDVICGRTTVKKGPGAPEWHETFTFSDLPPFGDMMIHLYREKRFNLKPQLLGSVSINPTTFRRGEMVEGWFPVISSGQSVNGLQVGEMKLTVKVDEEIVLPTTAYAPLLKCIANVNLLDLLNDLEQELKLQRLAEHMLAIAVMRNVLMDNLFELAKREVDNTSTSQNTLFRGNTVLTKTMELAMNWYGKSFLEASIGQVVRRLISEKVAIETDNTRSGKSSKDQEKSIELLVYWCIEFWNSIYSVRSDCPQELRRLFQEIRQLVENKVDPSNRDMKWQSVSAFCFLRFIVPAILHPHTFGLCHGMPPPPVQRSLTLIAKVLQSLANLNTSVKKEEYMGKVKAFIKDSIPAMIDYIREVSTPTPVQQNMSVHASDDKHDRIQAMNALRERKSTMPTLHKEALLFLPHLLDVPKHLAILTSAVVRGTRHHRARSPLGTNETLDNFTKSCSDIESEALRCVSQLGRRTHANGHRQIALASPAYSQTYSHVGSASTMSSNTESEDRATRSGRRRLSLRSARPSTAPPTPDTERLGARKNCWDDHDDTALPSIPRSEVIRINRVPQKESSRETTSAVEQPRRKHTSTGQSRPAIPYDLVAGRTGSGSNDPLKEVVEPILSPKSPDDIKKRKRTLKSLLVR